MRCTNINGSLFVVKHNPYKDVGYLSKIPDEYKEADIMAYKDEKTNQDFVMLLIATKRPIRFNMDKKIFEKMESTANDRWEWRKY